MKIPFKDSIDRIKQKKEAERTRQEEEQNQRIEKLRQLEEENEKPTGFHLPHPIKNSKRKKEIKTLREEIKVFEARKKTARITKKTAIITGAIFLVAVCILIVGTILEKRSSKRSPEQKETVSKLLEKTDDFEDDTTDVFDVSESETVGDTEPSRTDTTAEQEPDTETEEAVTTENTFPDESEIDELDGINYISASDLNVSWRTSLAHMSTEYVILGNDEEVVITVELDKGDLSADDLIFDYDDSLLDVDISEEERLGHTCVKATVSGKTECNTKLSVATVYDVTMCKNDDDTFDVYEITIQKLSQSNGRTVYVTNNGEKYHYSQACAGENYITTTIYDASGEGYTPCQKCVG